MGLLKVITNYSTTNFDYDNIYIIEESEVNLNMLKAYKYRLYPDNVQQNWFARTFGCCRFVYNQLLEKKIELYKTDKKSLSKIDCNNICNREMKKEYLWLKDIDKFALTNSIYNLDSAFLNFFRHIKNNSKEMGFPKFKSKHNHYYSYSTNFTNNNIEANFEKTQIKLPKIKWVKCKLHRKFTGKIKSATISQVPSGKFFVSVLVDTENIQLSKTNNVIGFKLEMDEFLIDSNNNHIQNSKTLHKNKNHLTKLQDHLHKMVKRSNNYEKEVKKIAIINEKISNIKDDFLNKISFQITNDNDIIISEDLKVFKWSEFIRQLTYKSKWKGRIYHKISPLLIPPNHQRDENIGKSILKQGLIDLKLG